MKKRQMLITVEKERIIEIRSPGHLEMHCEHCGDKAPMLSPDEAAAATALSSRAIYRLVEDGTAHFKETRSGLLLVCIASLTS